MITVANPIYDIVFKYLMEDERIARTILSALLKTEVTHVEVRPHEYTNVKRDTLSVFRIDFGATVRQDDGTEQLMLIELQKTWLPTETLRFRQYLGVQYQNPQNIIGEGRDTHALPMVAIYLLGHNVGEIEEPVLYVKHEGRDYEGRIVTKGLPNSFIDSLTHSSIIVQIPRLHGQINTRLDKVLSIFDQTNKSKSNQQMVTFDEDKYAGDVEMEHIVHRLLMATTDADVRQDMNVEDEYFSIIEKQDTEILMRTREIAEKNVELAEKNAQLTEKDAQLTEKDAQLTEKDAQLTEKDAQLTEKDAQLTEKDAQLTEKDAQLTEKDAQLTEKDAQLTEKDAQLTEQKVLLRTSIKVMLQANMTIEQIAKSLNRSADELEGILNTEE